MESNTPDHFYRRALPHYHPDDAPYFVTYRLQHTLSEVEHARLLSTMPGAEASEDDHARHFQRMDFILDAARHGPKYLLQSEIMAIIRGSLHYSDTRWMDVIAFTIMPNHVHFVASVTGEKTLPQIMQSLKGFTAREANKLLGHTGDQFWQSESYDRVVRKGRLGNTVRYILMNPVQAGLVSDWRDWPGSYLSPNFLGIETLGLKPRGV
jgi:putative transposase